MISKLFIDQILSITKEDYLNNPDKKAKVKRLEKEIVEEFNK